MAGDEFPPDLLEAQRAYWEADARVREVTGGLPSGPEVVAATAAVTDGRRGEIPAHPRGDGRGARRHQDAGRGRRP